MCHSSGLNSFCVLSTTSKSLEAHRSRARPTGPPYHDDVQESEVGENEKDGDCGETSVCGGYGRYIWGVDDVCTDGQQRRQKELKSVAAIYED